MKKYRFLIALILCWFASSISLYLLDLLWPTVTEVSILSILIKTFGMSIVIIIVLYAALNTKNKEKK
ncbi:MAG: hypothetical protein CMC94_05185 [Flavobacteriales bacterium]|nr:hypothetical protein [Flavobacteriales bacterium]|tara:strand:- start:279 stop:479 length:201 start_codon:yes stop_codon:yes gene_type:complete